MENFIAIDFETANKNPTSICSIGLVLYQNGKLKKEFYHLINPRMDFDPNLIPIHKIQPNQVANQPDFYHIWKEIVPHLPSNSPFVAHNALFDQRFLQFTCERYNIPYPKVPFFCTYSRAKALLPHLPNHKLDTVAKACGHCMKNHHHALADAKACAAIALKIL